MPTLNYYFFDKDTFVKNYPFYVHTYAKKYSQKEWEYQKGSYYNHLYLITEGSGTAEFLGKKKRFEKGDIFLYKKGVPIKYTPDNKCCYVKFVTFGGNAADNVLDIYSLPECVVLKEHDLEKPLDDLLNAIEENGSAETVSLKLYNLLLELGKTNIKHANEDNFQKVISFISRNYYKNISVSAVAEAVGVSESYIFKAIRKRLDTTFCDYLKDLRLYWSKYYLTNENSLSVKETAKAVGFNSTGYFIECFKAKNGITPLEYKIKNNTQK